MEKESEEEDWEWWMNAAANYQRKKEVRHTTLRLQSNDMHTCMHAVQDLSENLDVNLSIFDMAIWQHMR